MNRAVSVPARLRRHVPLDVIARFASDEISSQRVVDQSAMIVNGNRVELSLATWQKD